MNGQIQHRCRGPACCLNRSQTLNKFKLWIPKTLALLRLRRLSTSNWDAWHQALNVAGLLSMAHNLFAHVYLRAFSRDAVPESVPIRAYLADDGDHPSGINEADAFQVGDVAKALQVSACFWKNPTAWHALYLLRLALDTEIQIMDALIASTSSMSQLKEVMLHPGSGNLALSFSLSLSKHLRENAKEELWSGEGSAVFALLL